MERHSPGLRTRVSGDGPYAFFLTQTAINMTPHDAIDA